MILRSRKSSLLVGALTALLLTGCSLRAQPGVATTPGGGASPMPSTAGQGGQAGAKKDCQMKTGAGARQLALGQTYTKAKAWDRALDPLAKAALADDDCAAKAARQEIATALDRKEQEEKGYRARLPAPFCDWAFLDYLVYGFGALIALAILTPIFVILDKWVFRPIGHHVLKRMVKPDRSNGSWHVSLIGCAQEPYRSITFDEFQATMRSLSRNTASDGGPSAIGNANSMFFVPLSLTDLTGPKFEIQGLDVSQIAAAVQRLRDYFSYRFELRVDTVGTKPYVYASLSWGGRVERFWQIPACGEDFQPDFQEAGRQLAFSVFGDDLAAL